MLPNRGRDSTIAAAEGSTLQRSTSGTSPEYDEGGRTMERRGSLGQKEVRRSSSMFTRGFAAAVQPDARSGSVLGFGAAAMPVLQVILIT